MSDVTSGQRGPRRRPGLPVGPEQVRRAVINAAADLFARREVRDVSLRDIAAAAEVHVSLITRYVGTREQLLEAVLDDLSDQVATELRTRPLQQLGWELDSPMGRWTRVLLHFVRSGRTSHALERFNPVTALAEVIEDLYEMDSASARLRSAQITASALGWRIFEQYLVEAADLDDVPRAALHDELHHVHNRLGSMPWDAAHRAERSPREA